MIVGYFEITILGFGYPDAPENPSGGNAGSLMLVVTQIFPTEFFGMYSIPLPKGVSHEVVDVDKVVFSDSCGKLLIAQPRSIRMFTVSCCTHAGDPSSALMISCRFGSHTMLSTKIPALNCSSGDAKIIFCRLVKLGSFAYAGKAAENAGKSRITIIEK